MNGGDCYTNPKLRDFWKFLKLYFRIKKGFRGFPRGRYDDQHEKAQKKMFVHKNAVQKHTFKYCRAYVFILN